MVLSEEHQAKARSLTEAKEFGKVSDASEMQLEKAPLPIVIRVLGKVMEVRERHMSKAPSPMEVKVSGKATEAREEQYMKT